MTTFSIVIPTHRREKLLGRLLQSISEANTPKSLIEIFVVENGNSFCAEAICQRWSNKLPITYLYEKVASVSNARNKGVHHTSGEVVLFFDDDVYCHKSTLTAYDHLIQKFGLEHYYGGPLSIEYESGPPEWLVDFLPDSASGFSLGSKEKYHTAPTFLGGNHAIPRKWLIDANGFDDLCASASSHAGGAGGEENRLQQQLIDKGVTGVYSPSAEVTHYVPAERCSEVWALQRQYRFGYTQGLLQASNQNNKRTFLKIPLWVWKKYFRQKLICTLLMPFHKIRPERAFNNKIKLYEISGYMASYRQPMPPF